MAQPALLGATAQLLRQPALDPVPPARWPRHWTEREDLLEAQHDRLAALLVALIEHHELSQTSEAISPGPTSTINGQALSIAGDLGCSRLLWQLRLHLRLEERWLAQSHCLCPGHRAAHRQAASDALEGYQHARIESTTRLTWLRELQTWFDDHRKGIDARAYAQARSLVQP